MLNPLRRALLAPSSFSRTALPLRQPRAFSTSPSSPYARVTLTGYLIADPEVRTTSSGKEVLNYAVAAKTHGPAEDRQSSIFNISYFPGRNEATDNYLKGLKKGTLLTADADVNLKKYQDGDMKNRTAINMIHRQIEIIRRPRPTEEESIAETELDREIS